jgi:hypothetical protein
MRKNFRFSDFPIFRFPDSFSPFIIPSVPSFILLTKLDTFFEHDSSVENFALLVARVREDTKVVNTLACFARREGRFRQLSSEATKQRFAQMLETRFNI